MLGRIIMKIDTTFKQCFTSSILLCILKNNFQKPTHLIFCFFCFQILVEVNYFKFRWIISNKFELIRLNKNMKTKENWFKSFNDKNKPTEAVGIQTVAPPLPEENYPLVRVGVLVKVRVSFRVGSNQTIALEEICPLVGVRVWVRISFWGWGQFSLQPVVLELKQPPQLFCKSRCSKNFADFISKHLCWSLFLIK